MPSIHKNKVCAICGKAEGPNWGRHWKQQHPGIEVQELQPGQIPSNLIDSSKTLISNDQITQELLINKVGEAIPPKDNIN